MLLDAAAPLDVGLEKLTNSRVWLNLASWGYDIPDSERPDFVLFWDKDVRLARELERLGLRLYNPADAIEACDDKAETYLICKAAGLKQPESIISPKKFHADGLLDDSILQDTEKLLGYPCVLKEAFGSFGQQVHLVKNAAELAEIIRSCGDRPYLIQKYVAYSKGRDIRVEVVGGKVIAAMLRENEGDFRANLTNGGHATDVTGKLTEAQEKLALAAAETLKLDFAGVDLLYGEDGPLLCEVNSNAHFKNLYECTGVNAADHILRLICSKNK